MSEERLDGGEWTLFFGNGMFELGRERVTGDGPGHFQTGDSCASPHPSHTRRRPCHQSPSRSGRVLFVVAEQLAMDGSGALTFRLWLRLRVKHPRRSTT